MVVAVLQLPQVEWSQRDQRAAQQRTPKPARIPARQQKDAEAGQREPQHDDRVEGGDRSRQEIDRKGDDGIGRAERLHIQLHAVGIEQQVGPERIATVQKRLAHPPEVPQVQASFFRARIAKPTGDMVDAAEQFGVKAQRQSQVTSSASAR